MTINHHWALKYIGRPYIEGQYNCLSLVVDILKTEYGKETILFSNCFDTTLEKQKLLALGLEKYSSWLEHPVDGCVASMTYGVLARHIGIYYVYRGVGNIIHLSKTSGTVTCKISNLSTQGLKVIKYVDYSTV